MQIKHATPLFFDGKQLVTLDEAGTPRQDAVRIGGFEILSRLFLSDNVPHQLPKEYFAEYELHEDANAYEITSVVRHGHPATSSDVAKTYVVAAVQGYFLI